MLNACCTKARMRQTLLRIALSCVAAIALAVVCNGGIATNRYQISARHEKSVTFVQVVDGKVVLGKSTVGDGNDNRDALDCWYIVGGKFKNSLTGGYLAYDPAGKIPELSLVDKAGPGTDWTVTVKKGRGEERGTIQAAEGNVKGWYLIVEKDGLSLAKENADNVEAKRVYVHK